MSGLYIHIPFCRGKCPYCDFYSIPFSDSLANRYLDAVCRAIHLHPFGDLKMDTLYFGGGTPALMGPARIGKIIQAATDHFGLKNAEITLEANPTGLDGETLSRFRACGVNRISFGVQSLTPRELAALGRRHTVEEAVACIRSAADAGFTDISADLMLGIPLQSADSAFFSIDTLATLPLNHISAYLLKVEPDTAFAKRSAALCPDEDETAALYLSAIERLAFHGFEQYEISNFGRGGAKSQHNLKYWTGEDYLGIGPAAHSMIAGKRFYFPRDAVLFLEAENPFCITMQDGAGGGLEETVMLRLRLAEGLDTEILRGQFHIDTDEMLNKAREFAAHDLLKINDGVIALTPKGFLLSNTIILSLLEHIL